MNEFAEHCSHLSVAERDQLARSVQSCGDIQLYKKCFEVGLELLSTGPSGSVNPPTSEDFFDIGEVDETTASEGARLTREGAVAVLILAGGSGTRLGQSFPKGMLVCPDLCVPKSLFQIQCERVRRLQELTGGIIPVVFMTSEQTDSDTRIFFKENYNFGLLDDQISFFSQSSIPCFDLSGNVLLRDDTSVCVAPGGNAGIYDGIETSGILDTLIQKGVQYVQIFTVDNILAAIGDVRMTGYAAKNHCDVVVKATPKLHDQEAVGVFAKRDNKWTVVEYTEIGPQRASLRNESGSRVFNAANIAIHLFHVNFLKKAAAIMKHYTYYHAARKPIQTKDGTVQGIKLEAFIFDLFEFSENLKILLVPREEEFSAIKNSDDVSHSKADTPYTAVRALHALHTKWISTAATNYGVSISPTSKAEISPLVSLNGEGITRKHVDMVLSAAEHSVVVLD